MDYFMLAVVIETFFFLLFIIVVRIGIYFLELERQADEELLLEVMRVAEEIKNDKNSNWYTRWWLWIY